MVALLREAGQAASAGGRGCSRSIALLRRCCAQVGYLCGGVQHLRRLACQSALHQIVGLPRRLAVGVGRWLLVRGSEKGTAHRAHRRCQRSLRSSACLYVRLCISVRVGGVSRLSTDGLSGGDGGCSLGRSWPPCAMVWAIVSIDICVCCCSFGFGSGQLYRSRSRSASLRSRWLVPATASAPGRSARSAQLGQHALWQQQYVQQNGSQLTALPGHASQPVRVPQRLVGSSPLRLVVEGHALVQRAVLRHLGDQRRQLLYASREWLTVGECAVSEATVLSLEAECTASLLTCRARSVSAWPLRRASVGGAVVTAARSHHMRCRLLRVLTPALRLLSVPPPRLRISATSSIVLIRVLRTCEPRTAAAATTSSWSAGNCRSPSYSTHS